MPEPSALFLKDKLQNKGGDSTYFTMFAALALRNVHTIFKIIYLYTAQAATNLAKALLILPGL